MIRAIRPSAMAQDDATMVSGWNIAPNVAYTLILLPGATSCGVVLYNEDESVLIASGAALGICREIFENFLKFLILQNSRICGFNLLWLAHFIDPPP